MGFYGKLGPRMIVHYSHFQWQYLTTWPLNSCILVTPCISVLYFAAIDCVWSDWGPFGECDKTCGAGYRHSTRTSTGPFYGGAECVGDATQKQACNLMEELEMALESCQAENKRLKQQVNCEPSKCKITIYQEANANTETCGYLPDGLGDTECASNSCPVVSGRQTSIWNEKF